MLTVGTLFAIVQYNVDSSNIKITNFWMLHIVPVAHYWFVESLFIIFCLTVFLEKNNIIDDIHNFIFIFITVAIIFCTASAPIYFGLNGAIYLLPYFLFGLGVGRFNIKYRPFLIGFLSLILILLFLMYFSKTHVDIDRQTPVALFAGLMACYVLINLNFKSSFLSVIGVSSYSIYLYHVFFSASTRMITLIFTRNTSVHLVVGVFFAIVGSIALEKILSKHHLLDTFFLGKRYSKHTS
jgi:peptidoglycan/LPS O-acetylase OafA/YrhL